MKAQALLFEAPIAYGEAFELQKTIHSQRLRNEIRDTVLCLQHKPAITLGRRGRDNHLMIARDRLEAAGFELHQSTRGGDITCHGPGQWVVYPIINLTAGNASAHGYLWNLEEIAIRTASDFGVEAFRRPGMNGAWAELGKIAAVGFYIKRWVTMHGMSFNAAKVPEGFGHIVPCGLAGEKVSCMADLLERKCPGMSEMADSLLSNFAKVFDCELEITKHFDLDSLGDDFADTTLED